MLPFCFSSTSQQFNTSIQENFKVVTAQIVSGYCNHSDSCQTVKLR